MDIQHVGSTSVPGLCAKPIIDITGGLWVPLDKDCIAPLENIGYSYKGEAGVPGRMLFDKGTDEAKTHHLHLVEYEGTLWNNYINFRDYLRSHPDTMHEYSTLKKGLAATFANDRVSYTAKKDEFIKRTLLLARR